MAVPRKAGPVEAAAGDANASTPTSIVKYAYDRLFAGDLEAFLDCLGDNCVLVEAGSLPYGGRHVGREAIKAVVIQIGGIWSDFRFDIKELLTGETSVIAYGQMVVRGRATGIEVTFPLAERWVFDGVSVSEITAVYGDTALAITAAGYSAD